jgi:hypothetical protein
VSVKTKLAVFWIFVAVTNLAIVTLTYIAPGVLDDILAGHVLGAQIGPDLLLLVAITYFWVPLVMAVSSITLKDSINRWVNIIASPLYSLFVLSELVSNILKTHYLYGAFLQVSIIFVLGLVVWHSWKWPKK